MKKIKKELNYGTINIEKNKISLTFRRYLPRSIELKVSYRYENGKVGKFISSPNIWMFRILTYPYGFLLIIMSIYFLYKNYINSLESFIVNTLLLFFGLMPVLTIINMRRVGRIECNKKIKTIKK